jgi:hypothetical protein
MLRRTLLGVLGAALLAPAAAEAALPRVLVETRGRIVDDPKVAGTMRAPGHRGPIGIELRGETSQGLPKQQYGLETRTRGGSDRDVRLLGLPAESDWILSAAHTDHSLLRNALVYRTARRLGAYASRTRFVELWLNGRYRGVYTLMERLERGRDRVDADVLLELTTDAKLDRGEVAVRGPVSGRPIAFADPERRVPSAARRVAAFERALAAGPGWRAHLDEASAVDVVLLNELFKNHDAFDSSLYLHARDGGRLRLGPVWDFDLSMGNSPVPLFNDPAGWISSGRPWGERLFADRAFTDRLGARWRALRARGVLERVLADVDGLARQLRGAATRDARRWPRTGQPSHAEAVAGLKGWLTARAAWLDSALGA